AGLSPDEQRVVTSLNVQGNVDLWLRDSRGATRTRLTFDAALDSGPVWSPDGRRIAFTSNRTGTFNIYVKPSNGSGAEARLVTSPHNKSATDWSSDGRWLLYFEVHPTTGRDVWALDMTATDRPPRVVANTPADESMAQMSPDRRWVAYQTNVSGRFEVVVQPFDDSGGKWQVSTAGGVSPRWRADGGELYFLAPDATMMAVPVSVAGTSFEVGTPVALFPTRIVDGGNTRTVPQYAVARDGRFLINQAVAAAAAPITLMLNWNPEGKR
ncbi:MAG TPA: hypothetical protein VNT81_10250, partial [Vicinamibacterales bacterium]|nr:hypothetical protein [Vicinamibacterales bacterium]